MASESFTCPRCGAESHHPLDAAEGYCGECHDWTAPWPGWERHIFDRDGAPMTLRRFTECFNTTYAHVGMTAVGDDAHISTVWLGIDHSFGLGSPLIFETMVFGGPLSGEHERYPTIEAARAGHERWVAAAREHAGHHA